MPDTITSVLILAFAVLPGVPGDKIYKLLVGYDWREDQWHRALRLLGFSVFGLALYSTVAALTTLPAAAYLNPGALESAARTGNYSNLLGALLGHFIAAALAGLGAALAVRIVGRRSRFSVFHGSWDHFVFQCVPQYWIILGLRNGEIFRGILEAADTSVGPGERDIVLQQPAWYNPDSQQYEEAGYHHLFIPGELVASVGVLHESRVDDPIRLPSGIVG